MGNIFGFVSVLILFIAPVIFVLILGAYLFKNERISGQFEIDFGSFLFSVGIVCTFIIPMLFSTEREVSVWFIFIGINSLLIGISFFIINSTPEKKPNLVIIGYFLLVYSMMLSAFNAYISEYIIGWDSRVFGFKIILTLTIIASIFTFIIDFFEEKTILQRANIRNTLKKISDIIGVLTGILEIIVETGKIVIKLFKIIQLI